MPMEELERIVRSMAEEAGKAGVQIVTGDTKIINKGKADKIFINTAGVGKFTGNNTEISYGKKIQPGDKLIVNGDLGRHEIAILASREDLGLKTPVESDCASLNTLIDGVLSKHQEIRFMRDLTRGGLATVLNEVVEDRKLGIHLRENQIPITDNVKSICEMLGLDPLFLANEGRLVLVAGSDEADDIVNTMNQDILGKDAAIIGEVTRSNPGQVLMETEIGGTRMIDMLTGQQLPRIC
jgi:hydrogenase expression/formation protein HypE